MGYLLMVLTRELLQSSIEWTKLCWVSILGPSNVTLSSSMSESRSGPIIFQETRLKIFLDPIFEPCGKLSILDMVTWDLPCPVTGLVYQLPR